MKTDWAFGIESGDESDASATVLGYNSKKDRMDSLRRKRSLASSKQTFSPSPYLRFSDDFNFIRGNDASDDNTSTSSDEDITPETFEAACSVETNQPTDGSSINKTTSSNKSTLTFNISENDMPPETITPASSAETSQPTDDASISYTASSNKPPPTYASINKTASSNKCTHTVLKATDSAHAELEQVQSGESSESSQSYPRNPKRSRLSWAPEIMKPAKHGFESDLESLASGEAHPLIQKMKNGVADALVNSVVALPTYQAVVMSVIDSKNHSYSVKRNSINDQTKWRQGGDDDTIELDPGQHGDVWSIIGKKSERGRISFHRVIHDIGEVKATGARQGSSTASKKMHTKKRCECTQRTRAKNTCVKSQMSSICTPAVVRQNRTTYRHTPLEGSKRQNDLKLQSMHAIGKITEDWLPNRTPRTRVGIIADALETECKFLTLLLYS